VATAKEYAKAIIEHRGNISRVAAQFGVTRQAVYKAMERHPSLREAHAEAKERMLDHAESQLFKAIDKGDVRAIALFLKTQGKHRGYVERQERLHSGEINYKRPEEMSDEELDAAIDAFGA